MRELCSNRHCPNIGKLEFIVFPKLINVSPYKIYCLESQRRLRCAHLDGWIEELKLVIEFDEEQHYSEEAQLLDNLRQDRIKQELGEGVTFLGFRNENG